MNSNFHLPLPDDEPLDSMDVEDFLYNVMHQNYSTEVEDGSLPVVRSHSLIAACLRAAPSRRILTRLISSRISAHRFPACSLFSMSTARAKRTLPVCKSCSIVSMTMARYAWIRIPP